MLTLFQNVGKSGIISLLCLASCSSPVVLGPWLLQLMRAQQGMCWPQAAHVGSGPVLTGTLLSAQLQLVC